jgi:hypothetical protein
MRIVKEINHPSCKISIFSWNGKYLIKFEQGDLEQTYKIDEMELTGDDDLHDRINESFINDILVQFRNMNNIIIKHFDDL